jgi:hypothetical protein
MAFYLFWYQHSLVHPTTGARFNQINLNKAHTEKPNAMKKRESKTWITEREAAQIIELPGKFFRKLVTEGPLKGVVNYFKSKRAAYRYNKIELENYLFENSFLAGL